MLEHLVPAIRAALVTLLLTGIAYPLATTAVAQALFSERSNGSLVRDESGDVVGSELIGQAFGSPASFQPRHSAAGDKGWDPTSSGGSNLGPTSQKLRERAAAELERLRRENPAAIGLVPAELLTTSGSGLDPHLSPDAALWQVPRVAKARGVDPERVRAVVDSHVEGRNLGFLGEPRVNVLRLNLALDRVFGRAPRAAR